MTIVSVDWRGRNANSDAAIAMSVNVLRENERSRAGMVMDANGNQTQNRKGPARVQSVLLMRRENAQSIECTC